MRYLIIDRERGVFLGTYLTFVLFAINGGFDIEKAVTFESEEKARKFVEEMLDPKKIDYFVAPIKTTKTYVGLVEIIKAGYGKYTHRILDNLPMISEEIH